MEKANDGNWVADDRSSGRNPLNQSKQQIPQQPSNLYTSINFDPQDLTSFRGVSELKGAKIPQDILSHTKSNFYKVKKYYQVDNVDRWRDWQSILQNSGGREEWLFYACPLSMIGGILMQSEIAPYGDFFPKVFGQNALYLFERADQAARVAFKFGVEIEGYLISCRASVGKIFKTRHSNPQATESPRGYDFIMATRGTDLGNGALDCDMYATFSPNRLLIRYVTHIENPIPR